MAEVGSEASSSSNGSGVVGVGGGVGGGGSSTNIAVANSGNASASGSIVPTPPKGRPSINRTLATAGSNSPTLQPAQQASIEPTRIFGVRLAEVMKRSTQSIIPSFIKHLIHYLTTQALTTAGLFRVSPNPKTLLELKQKIDNGEALDKLFPTDSNTSKEMPHNGAALLKAYLRELPEPLLTFALYHDFINATSFAQSPGYVDHISALLNKLPAYNKSLLEILLLFFAKVAQLSNQNTLTSAHLAIVFGPLILRPEVETIESANNTPKVIAVVKFMIDKFDRVFIKPATPEISDLASFFDVNTDVLFEGLNDKQKIEKLRGTIEDAIILLQSRLDDITKAIEETESQEAVTDIAKRIRASKRVLFNDNNMPMAFPLLGYKCPKPAKKGINSTSAKIPKPISGAEELQGKRKTMEDTHVNIDDLNKLFPSLPKNAKRSFFAVYDGHSGKDAANLAQEHLHKNILTDPSFAEGDMFKATINAYRKTDKYILETEAANGWKNGTTAVTILIINNLMYVANCGDSEAIMAKKRPHGLEAVEISAKHKPNDPKEKKRIEDLGGAVFGGRVFGTLAVSRSLGDPEYKLPISQANFISAEPYVACYNLEEDVDQFLVVACDGLWDKMNYQEVVDFVSRSFDNGNDVQQTSALLARESIDRGSSDNVSAIVVLLQWNSTDD